MTKPLLYIAAPYTREDPVLNTHRVCRVASEIYDYGDHVPLIPHLNLVWHLIDPRPVEDWYEYDLELLARCDLLVRLPGPSTGADREVTEAQSLGIGLLPYDELPYTARCEWILEGVA